MSSRLRGIILGLFIICIATSAWLVVSAIVTSQTTGILRVTSSDSHASLIVSQDNRQALVFGAGHASIRLKPGSYQISASNTGKQTSAIVAVYKKHTTNSYLKPLQSVSLPSVEGVSYVGLDSFLNYGMPSSQLDNLKQALFQFSKSIHSVVVNPDSISPTPHDRNSASTMSSINFKITVDSISYNAVMNYDNLGGGFRLYLYDPQSNGQVFDSGATSVPGGD